MPKLKKRPAPTRAKSPPKSAPKGSAPPRVPPTMPGSIAINLQGRRLRTLNFSDRRFFQQQAMRWSYALKNRERWNTQPDAALHQQREMKKLAEAFGLDRDALEEIANAGLVEVAIPWTIEEDGWEHRIFPWEYMIASATRDIRGTVKPLTVVRHLAATVPGAARSGTPTKWLQVVSAPGGLAQIYDFSSERNLVRLNATGSSDGSTLEVVEDPDEVVLRAKITQASPDVIHLSGLDTHQATRLVPKIEGKLNDGFLLRGAGSEPHVVEAKALAPLLTCAPTKPRLVSCNIFNSGLRIAPLCVADGAQAAIGFQDSFDDGLAEIFYSTLYSAWRLADWNIVSAFDFAWQTVRRQGLPLQGSGIVLWNSESIVGEPQVAPAQKSERSNEIRTKWKVQTQDLVLTPENIRDMVGVEVEVIPQLNYAILHNNGPIFRRFRISKKSNKVGKVDGLMVDIEVNVGTDSYPFRTEASIDETVAQVDMPESIRISLASALSRSIRESIHTSLYISVTWKGVVLYRQTHRVTLLPVDEWRFDTDNYRWLPSFVLPRDPAVNRIIDSAQRYLMALRDDATAGFDGYQSVEFKGKSPAIGACTAVDMQVRAIWSALLYEQPLSYINPPPVFTESSQRLRTPSDCLESRRGTCIDLALLLAACLEYVEIYPVVFLLETHAFPAYWRHDSFHENFRAALSAELPEGEVVRPDTRRSAQGQVFGWDFQRGQYRELLGEVQAGRLVPLETTLVTGRGSFADAMSIGLENVASRKEFESMLDIILARTDEKSSVTPLPIRRGEV